MYKNIFKTILCAGIMLFSFSVFAQTASDIYGKARLLNKKDTGYRGIWYNIGGAGQSGPVTNEYRYKYSGGLGTYPANHYPFSVYSKKVNKTFFCYGGTDSPGKTLCHMVSFFDHNTGEVPCPTIVLDKATDDAHDNPVMQVDKDGYIWIFSTSHGTGRPSFIHRSKLPYDINEFERVPATKIVDGKKVAMDNFSYLQMYYSDKNGFTGLFTHYEKVGGRVIAWMTSKDGTNWSEWKDLSLLGEGQYQTSGNQGKTIGTSFNYHPHRKVRGGLDFRTNIYYLQTKDFGKTWQTVDGSPIELPLKNVSNKALVHDYDSEERNVYICDVNFDQKGNPVILYITSKGPMPGPEDGPHEWHTARWTGKQWEINPFTDSDSNYDMGSLYIEKDGIWRIVAPTQTGPQAYNAGGEMVMWASKNQGKSWEKVKQITHNSEFNHTYARRPVNGQPGFYAFWADGHGRQPSESRLYFSDKDGNVYLLPEQMPGDFAKPVLYKSKIPESYLKAREWTDYPMKHEMTEIWNPEVQVVTPGETPADAPSDALILFDGKDLSQWNVPENTEWKIKNGIVTITASTERLKGPVYIASKKEFEDIQLHIEWRAPAKVDGSGQERGNSGVFFQGLYEVQVLDNFNNRTYRNGQAGSIYKQYAPLVNACKAPGEWQVYDIVYTAPRFRSDGTYFTPPYVTVIHNGVLVQDHAAVRGPDKYIGIPEYFVKPHGAGPILLQDHGSSVSFRNIWIREL